MVKKKRFINGDKLRVVFTFECTLSVEEDAFPEGVTLSEIEQLIWSDDAFGLKSVIGDKDDTVDLQYDESSLIVEPI